jgi:chromosome segregation ATPase
MKNFHQNLLITLALSLCVLCIYQWYGQMQQHKQMESLGQLLSERNVAIQGYTNSIRAMDTQIAQMDKQLAAQSAAMKSNESTQLDLRREISRLHVDSEVLTNQVAQYKESVVKLEASLKEAYDGIKKQNDAIKELTAQRDEFVQKFNDSVNERNDVVNKYNELVKKMEK